MTPTAPSIATIPDVEIDGIVAQFGNPDTCAAWVAAKDSLRIAKAGNGSVVDMLATLIRFERTARQDYGVRYKLGLR